MSKYNIDDLKKINSRFCHEHCLDLVDVGIANKYVSLIEGGRSTKVPQAGDRIRYTNSYGEYFGRAHIELVEDGEARVCEAPYTPFVWEKDDKQIVCVASGGAWCDIPTTELVYVGKEEKHFCAWGSCGPCADGAIEFQAEVSVWEYTSPDNPYAPYTTKDYDRAFISFVVDEFGNPKDGSNYRYFGDGFAFKTTRDYQAWLRTYRGVEFKGVNENHKVVFLYREKCYYISKEEWDALNYPIDTRMCNGIILVKVLYDDEGHCIHAYRYTNDGSGNRETHPYMLARQELL